ncbi:MAG: glycosyltransferase [Candidatus Aenigmarchaeota archaeon]|nr:glycosyltransferase [Candidatus Aenigmarchaeota archaeon]
MKVAILHDFFTSVGGGEKVVIALAKRYDADIYTYFWDKTKTFDEIKNFRVYTSNLKIKTNFLKQVGAARFFETLKPKKDYDVYLMYGWYSILAGKHLHPNVWVAGAPPKNLYLKEYYDSPGSLKRKWGLKLFRKLFLKKNQNATKNDLDFILAVSKFQKENIEKLYKRKKNLFVVYPPAETKKFYYRHPEDFYLTVSRLEPLKRVELIVKAFMKMPDKKLVVVGDGTQRKYLEELAKNNKNIEFKGPIYGKELIELYARCTAFVFMSKMEDYGIVPVEAMAAGKPVIGVNEGGVIETVVNKKTGLIIPPNEAELIKAVKSMTPEKAIRMKEACIKRSREFDIDVYYRQVDEIIKNAIKSYKN